MQAIFYCCWNTAYCDYPCQQAHWPKHMTTCANANQYTEDGDVSAEQVSEVQQTEAAHSSVSNTSSESPAKVVVTTKTTPVGFDKIFTKFS